MGFDWDPVKKDMWFTDNGKDNRNDTLPPDELNTAITFGQHFGFPYLFGAKPDEKFWPQRPYGKGFVNPRYELDAHAGAQGMRFYTRKMFGEKYRGGIFIAEHGTTGYNIRSGYRITFVPIKTGRPMGYEVFCSGWLDGDHAWGTPADVLRNLRIKKSPVLFSAICGFPHDIGGIGPLMRTRRGFVLSARGKRGIV